MNGGGFRERKNPHHKIGMETAAFVFVWKAVVLGVHAGASPGPITTMLVSQSLLHGRRAGAKIAFVPVLTDLPIIAVVIPCLYYLSLGLENVIALIALIGACLLCYLGYESLTVTASQFQQNNAPSISLLRAVGVNFFNPNVYIYWLTICGPLSVSALHVSVTTMLLFIGVFFISITSVKLGIALALGSVRQSLDLKVIIWINRLLGIVMFVIAASFFWKGCNILFA